MDGRYKRFFVGRVEDSADFLRILNTYGVKHNYRPGAVYTNKEPLIVATEGEEPIDSIVDLTFALWASRGMGKAYCSLCYLCVNTDLSPIPSLSCVISHGLKEDYGNTDICGIVEDADWSLELQR